MASKTAATESKRKAKARKQGRRRRNLLETRGSTPKAAKLFGDE